MPVAMGPVVRGIGLEYANANEIYGKSNHINKLMSIYNALL